MVGEDGEPEVLEAAAQLLREGVGRAVGLGEGDGGDVVGEGHGEALEGLEDARKLRPLRRSGEGSFETGLRLRSATLSPSSG